MAEPEQNEEPQGEEEQPKHPFMTPEMLQGIIDDAAPLLKVFSDIWTNEKTEEEQLHVIYQPGMLGAIGNLIDQSLPPQIVRIAPYNFVDLAQRCVLFGYVLDEIISRAKIEGKDLTSDDLEKLWDVVQEEEGEETNDNDTAE